MPLPTPKEGEEQKDFMERCMGNPTMNEEYPEQDQRAAICNSQWRRDKKEQDMKYSGKGPKPKDGETEGQFGERCMADPEMIEEYPDEDERGGACSALWNPNPKEPPSKSMCGGNRKIFAAVAKVTDICPAERTLVAKISTDCVDRTGDIILPEGIDLTNYDKNRVVLWCHQYNIPPIAKSRWIKVERSSRALAAMPQFAETQFASEIYSLYEKEFLNAWSIGFLIPEGGRRKATEEDVQKRADWAGAQSIIEHAELLEYSAVPIPANPEALSRAISKGLSVPKDILDMVPLPSGELWEYMPVNRKEQHEAIFHPLAELLIFTLTADEQAVDGRTVTVISGRSKEDEGVLLHAYRYDAIPWTIDEASKHAKSAGAKHFDPAAPQIRPVAPAKPIPSRTVRWVPPVPPAKPHVQKVGTVAEQMAQVEARRRGRIVWEP